jgi:hypothetical protein
MKKIFAAVLISLPALLFAQFDKPYIGIKAGTNVPISPNTFSEYWSTAYYFGATFEKPIANVLSLGSEASHSVYSVNGSGGITGDALKFTTVTAYLKFGDNNTEAGPKPFARLGAGISFTSGAVVLQNFSMVYDKPSSTGYAVLLGTGVDINLKSLDRLTFEGAYRLNHIPGTDFGGISIGFAYHFRL